MSELISRQAAIDGKISIQRSDGVEIYDDYAVPVEYLKQLPSIQPAPCEDAVSRADILSMIDDMADDVMDGFGFAYEQWKEQAEELPPVTPKQRTGKWIPSDSQCGIRCSACGVPVDDFCHSIDYIDLDYEPNFCPNCGAKMEGGTE